MCLSFQRTGTRQQRRTAWLASPSLIRARYTHRTQPARLQALGYIVEKTGETQRILPHAVAQPMTMSSSGALVAASEASTKPLALHITNAGIATVEQYDLRMP
jgi:hypothetical protein